MALIPHEEGCTTYDCVTREGEINLQSSGELWVTAWHPHEHGSDINLSLYYKVDRERALKLAVETIKQHKKYLWGELALTLKQEDFALFIDYLELIGETSPCT